MTRDEWARRYTGWAANRCELSERENAGKYPSANEWEWSDDEGVELAHAAAALLGVES